MIEALATVYFFLILTVLSFSFVVYLTDRNEVLYKLYLFYWSSILLSFLSQFLVLDSLPLSLFTFVSSHFLVALPYCRLISLLGDVPIRVRLYYIAHTIGCGVSFLLFLLDLPFWVYATPSCLTMGLNLIVPALVANLKVKQNMIFRVASVNFVLLGLHDIDYAFLRAMPELMAVNFTIAIILSVGFGMFLPVLMLEKIKRRYSSFLEVQVQERTKALEKTRTLLVEKARLANLGGLVAGITHEVNNPLNFSAIELANIKSALVNLQHSPNLPHTENHQTFESTNEMKNSLERLTKHLVQVNKLMSRFKNLAIDVCRDSEKTIDLVSYLRELCASMNWSKNKRITLHFSSPDQDKFFYKVYPGLLFQVLSNLVINSDKHGFRFKEQGKIKVDLLLSDPEFIKIVYSDDGQGIEPATQNRIFEPFFTTKPGAAGGSGMGLTIVYSIIVDQLGGRISVRSIGQICKGIEFTLWLPKRESFLQPDVT